MLNNNFEKINNKLNKINNLLTVLKTDGLVNKQILLYAKPNVI